MHRFSGRALEGQNYTRAYSTGSNKHLAPKSISLTSQGYEDVAAVLPFGTVRPAPLRLLCWSLF